MLINHNYSFKTQPSPLKRGIQSANYYFLLQNYPPLCNIDFIFTTDLKNPQRLNL